ncbi:MAG: BTAD domain-containing putative transcriptional regulator [Mycobacteriales bacterium]
MDGAPRTVAGLRRKAVLAVLALHPGQAVSTDRLIDVVWGGDAPATAPNTLQSHISYLRRALGASSAIVACAPGYLLDVAPESTDVEVAERLIREGRQAADRAHGASCLRAAVGLWRGRALADVAELAWLHEQSERLEHVRRVAEQELIDTRLALGEHAQLVPELERRAREHPYDEHVHGQLMRALYRSGRQTDALAVYQRLRQTLAEGLGVDPGPALQDLEAAVLRHDPSLWPAAGTAVPAAHPSAVPPPPSPPGPFEPSGPSGPSDPPVPVPAQLPTALPGFAGRRDPIAQLDGLLAGPDAVAIAALSGTAGIGKTTLALHWAHRVAHHFPDGQLYVNLCGFDPGDCVVEPAEVLRGFLEAFGTSPPRIPAGLEDRAALYRSVLAGKRVLIVLDNARDADQVRPLLPGTAGCAVVVTSRNQLIPLVATEGARPLTLDLLDEVEARDLLAGRLGAARVAAEAEAVTEIVARCARLPLALAITAALATGQPDFPLARLAGELRDAAGALDVLRGGDEVTDVRAVFSWSSRALSPAAARLFRLLGLHPGPDFTVPAASSLAGLPAAETRSLVAELARAHLVTEHVPGRYASHDLLRVYSAEQARAHETEADRHDAVRRLLDHYLHTAYTGTLLLEPSRERIEVPAPAPGVVPEELAGMGGALAWFAAEHAVMTAALHQPPAHDPQVWALAWTMVNYLQRRGHRHEWLAAQQRALAAGQRMGDLAKQAYSHRSIGVASAELGDRDEALDHYGRALRLYAETGDRAGQAHTHLNLAMIRQRQDRLAEAVGHDEQALELYRAAGHPVGTSRTLNTLGWHLALLGDLRQALRYCEEAIELTIRTGDLDAQSWTWDSLGYIHHHLGAYDRAIACYARAVGLIRELGDLSCEGETLVHLGESQYAAGDREAARATWQQALDVFTRMRHPDAAEVRVRLDALDVTARQLAVPLPELVRMGVR